MNHNATAPADTATLRRDLAAAYRLAALFGWDDTLYTHFSVRLPGAAPRFLINPFGLLFEEIRASDLIVVDMHGAVVEGEADYNVAGFTIHSAVHMAREDAHCVIHTHTLAGMAVAAQDAGLLQLNQISTEFHQAVGYHPYEGIALDLDERQRIQASLGGHDALILRHHGLLSVGPSIADAFYVMYYLNRACEIQLSASSSQLAYSEIPAALSQHAHGQFAGTHWQRQLLWQAWLRKLDRLDPGYRD
ncbi:class II aldolase/adducin family protein [Phytopseudomonas dryadis]|uniref:Class II aldolase n=1 Tax=Phytopseudomonas dryadis TaxID=2487520 RepID=A0A4Q9R4J4_9GAMM|nr:MULTISPECIES: class II aldolase/adducin family protein [Pseudomonas]TBU95426.1 class II aldolase [Pseudomonas dryadis]TBV03833.1 class II aldolase [Pseudomonas dryadis]TBV19851.1 class II aldolase [Pseudomonas sp. FRB 230]